MLKEGYQDEIHINTKVRLGWRDRLRVLWHGELELRTQTQTENLPGKLETTSSVVVRPFYMPQYPNVGMAECKD